VLPPRLGADFSSAQQPKSGASFLTEISYSNVNLVQVKTPILQRKLNVSEIFRQAKTKRARVVVSRAIFACSKKVRRIHWYRAVNAKALGPASAFFANLKSRPHSVAQRRSARAFS
jgi:hypothetical protein